MEYKIKARELLRKIIWLVSVTLIVLMLCWLYIEWKSKPVILAMAEAKVKALASVSLNEAIGQLVTDDVAMSELVSVIRDSEGKVALVQANTMRINALGSKAALTTQKKIAEAGEQGVGIPLGAILGSRMMASKGPVFDVKIIPIGTVTTEFRTEFEQAGINQTRHRILMGIKMQVRIVIPTGAERIDVSVETPISETIIVGAVPGTYINVDETDDMLNLIP